MEKWEVDQRMLTVGAQRFHPRPKPPTLPVPTAPGREVDEYNDQAMMIFVTKVCRLLSKFTSI